VDVASFQSCPVHPIARSPPSIIVTSASASETTDVASHSRSRGQQHVPSAADTRAYLGNSLDKFLIKTALKPPVSTAWVACCWTDATGGEVAEDKRDEGGSGGPGGPFIIHTPVVQFVQYLPLYRAQSAVFSHITVVPRATRRERVPEAWLCHGSTREERRQCRGRKTLYVPFCWMWGSKLHWEK
jgi:hypothetical protein